MINIREYLSTVDRRLLYKLGIVVVLYLAFFMFFFIPSIKEYRQLQAKRLENRDVTKRALKNAEQIAKLSQEKLQLDVLLKDANSMIASPKAVKSFLGDISQLATLSDVKIIEITPVETALFSEGTVAEYCTTHAFQIDMECGYHELGKFVDRIENYQNLARIISLQMLPGVKSEKIHIARMQLVIFGKMKELVPNATS